LHFFRGLAKLTGILKKSIQRQNTILSSIKVAFVAMYATRWILRHNCIKQSEEMFISIANTLENIENSMNEETSTRISAHQL
jgi:hypothetical protein